MAPEYTPGCEVRVVSTSSAPTRRDNTVFPDSSTKKQVASSPSVYTGAWFEHLDVAAVAQPGQLLVGEFLEQEQVRSSSMLQRNGFWMGVMGVPPLGLSVAETPVSVADVVIVSPGIGAPG